MSFERPDIPRPLRRSVLMEAGYRCAIPTCRQVPVEIHHIIPWADVLKHEEHNLIALCRNDHGLAGDGTIDRAALRIYKRNLALVNSRYTQAEHRLLDMFIDGGEEHEWTFSNGTKSELAIRVDSNHDFDFYFLLRDGLLRRLETNGPRVGDVPFGPQLYALTAEGRAFIADLRDGRPTDELR